jgi:hypothetical protein
VLFSFEFDGKSLSIKISWEKNVDSIFGVLSETVFYLAGFFRLAYLIDQKFLRRPTGWFANKMA